jgi:hypothetical protein
MIRFDPGSEPLITLTGFKAGGAISAATSARSSSQQGAQIDSAECANLSSEYSAVLKGGS